MVHMAPLSVRSLRRAPAPVLAATLVLALAAVAVVVAAVRHAADGRDGPDGGPRDHTVSLDRGGRDAAVLRLASGADAVRVSAAGPGDRLLEATTPDGSRAYPRLDGPDGSDGAVSLWLDDGPGGGPADAAVHLSRDVRWTVSLVQGAKDVALDLRDLRVPAVELRQGVGAVSMTLPRPGGVVPVRLLAGAGTVAVRVPQGVGVRVRVGGGAGSAVVDGATRGGLSAGTVLTTDDWRDGAAGYDVTLAGGVGSVTVERS